MPVRNMNDHGMTSHESETLAMLRAPPRSRSPPLFPNGGMARDPADRLGLFQAVLPIICASDPEVLSVLLTAGNIALYWRCVDLLDTLEITLGSQTHAKPKVPEQEHSRGLKVQASSSASHPLFPTVRLSPLMIWQASGYRDDPSAQASGIIRRCTGVTSLTVVAIAHLPRLRRLFFRSSSPHVLHEPSLTSLVPRLNPALQLLRPPGLTHRPSSPPLDEGARFVNTLPARIVGPDGFGLGSAWEHLEVLHLEGLDQIGSRNLATHFQMLCEDGIVPTLLNLHLSTHFMDLTLLSAVGRLGSFGSLRRLELGTSGTKVNAECLQVVLKLWTELEALVLRDVEGRLEKGTWSSIEIWPKSLRTLLIEISEHLPHHSWTLQHLQSIHRVPFAQLTTFVLRRILHPLALLPFPPPSVLVPAPQDTHRCEGLPNNLLEVICRHGDRLSALCLTWWEMDEEQLLKLLKTIPNVRHLEITIGISMQRLLSLAPSFGTLRTLETLVVVSSAEANRFVTGRAHAPAITHSDLASLPRFLAERLREPDVTIPDLKEIRKLVRRTPTLQRLSWTGRGGKGEWRFSHPKKGSSLISVDFVHSAILTREIFLQSLTRPPPPPSTESQSADTVREPARYLRMPNTPGNSPHSVSTALHADLTSTSNEAKTALRSSVTSPTKAKAPLSPNSGVVPSLGLTGLRITGRSSPSPQVASPQDRHRATSGSAFRPSDGTPISAPSTRKQRQRANSIAPSLSSSTSRTGQTDVKSIFKPDVVFRSDEFPALKASTSSRRTGGLASSTSAIPKGKKSSASSKHVSAG